ncbi:acetyl-CoA carboxylase biotin carboxyl carrier protein subunit [bacterium]|nr:acetyl-CoA carboxylase biotin carboxyl carrier protein subunit [bacterium]
MKLKITVHGVAYEVDVEVLDAEHDFLQQSPLPPQAQPAAAAPMAAPAAPPRGSSAPAPTTGDGSDVLSPIAGTVLEIKCKAGDEVKNGQELMVIEAMKMETGISAHRDGKIKAVPVAAGDSVRENELLVEFE